MVHRHVLFKIVFPKSLFSKILCSVISSPRRLFPESYIWSPRVVHVPGMQSSDINSIFKPERKVDTSTALPLDLLGMNSSSWKAPAQDVPCFAVGPLNRARQICCYKTHNFRVWIKKLNRAFLCLIASAAKVRSAHHYGQRRL